MTPSRLCSFLQSCENLTHPGGPEGLGDLEVTLALRFLETHSPTTTSQESNSSPNTARQTFYLILQAVIEAVNVIPSSTTLELPATNEDLTGDIEQVMTKLLETSFDKLYHSIFFGKDDTQKLELLNQLLEMGRACHGGRKR